MSKRVYASATPTINLTDLNIDVLLKITDNLDDAHFANFANTFLEDISLKNFKGMLPFFIKGNRSGNAIQVLQNRVNILQDGIQELKGQQELTEDQNNRLNSFTASRDKYMLMIKLLQSYHNQSQDGGRHTITKRKSLDDCTLVELKTRADKRGISIHGLNKSEIIAKLRRKK